MAEIQTFNAGQFKAATAGTSLPVLVVELDGDHKSRIAVNVVVDHLTGETRPARPLVGSDLTVNADPGWSDWEKRWLPVLENPKAHVMVRDARGMVVNSLLDKREWAELDREIFEMVKLRKNAIADLQSAGLTSTTNLGEMLSQWRVSTERTRPSVNMDGRSRADRDLTDRLVYSVPIPIFRTDYTISAELRLK